MSGAPEPAESLAASRGEDGDAPLGGWCATEISVAGLVAGAVVLSALLWLAVLAVL